jgi:hypothetical protein
MHTPEWLDTHSEPPPLIPAIYLAAVLLTVETGLFPTWKVIT